ncbi:hypothetical protein [uncultured Clostridium sp.]|nr:hypothetical protein [uncultured Clostridium sp.]
MQIYKMCYICRDRDDMNKKTKILIVEDENDINKLLCSIFEV